MNYQYKFLTIIIILFASNCIRSQSLKIGENTEFDLGSAVISISSDIEIDGTFTGNNGKIIFSGSSGQNIRGDGAINFYDMEINNSGGVEILTDITVHGNINFLNGKIYTSTNKLLSSSGNFSNHSSSSYIVGNLSIQYSGNDTKLFCVGSNTAYRPVTIDLTDFSGTSGYLSVSQTDGSPLINTFPDSVTAISEIRFWDITKDESITSFSAAITLTWGNDDLVSDINHLTVVRGSEGSWDQTDLSPVTNGTTESGDVTGSGFTDPGNFTFGNIEGGTNVFPVELVLFSASVLNDIVKLEWKTETEINTYGFDIEKQLIGEDSYSNSRKSFEDWEKIGFVEGAGNSNSPRKYTFIDDYPGSGKIKYRLKIIDNDGSSEYSDVIQITTGDKPDKYHLFQNYPNPFNAATSIRFSLPEDSRVELSIFNELGELVATLISKGLGKGFHTYHYNAELLPSGIYLYSLKTDNYQMTKKMILLK